MNESLKHISRVLFVMDVLAEEVRVSSHAHHWAKLKTYAEALFERGPFKVGDRVRLTRTPVINEKERWGWLGSKHFLIEGALGTVHEVDFADGYFWAGVHWDDESWIDRAGVKCVKKPEDRSRYHHSETYLERVTAERGWKGGDAP